MAGSKEKLQEDKNWGQVSREFNLVFAVTLFILALQIFVMIGLAAYFQLTRSVYDYEWPTRGESWLAELQSAEQEILNSYELLDGDNQVYRIPVRRAMELMAEEEQKK